jgi:hypothetical protein
MVRTIGERGGVCRVLCAVSSRCRWSGHGGGLERAGVVTFEGAVGGGGGGVGSSWRLGR